MMRGSNLTDKQKDELVSSLKLAVPYGVFTLGSLKDEWSNKTLVHETEWLIDSGFAKRLKYLRKSKEASTSMVVDTLRFTKKGRFLRKIGNLKEYEKYLESELKREKDKKDLEQILLKNSVSITTFQKNSGWITIGLTLIIAALACYISWISYKLNEKTFEYNNKNSNKTELKNIQLSTPQKPPTPSNKTDSGNIK